MTHEGVARRRGDRAAVWLPTVLVTMLIAAPAVAQSAPAPSEPKQPGFWGFNGSFGTGHAGGDFGNLFVDPVTWDYGFFRQQGAWRFGAGVTFESFKMKDPYQHELEWGFQQIYGQGTRLFRRGTSVRPYVQVRAGLARLRPRSELFEMDPLPPDWKKGQATQAPSTGFAFALVPGLEVKLNRAAFLDASVGWTNFNVSEYDLSPVGQPPRSSGSAFEGRLGITWIPNGEQHGEREATPRDAWGVKKSYGWAAGEVLAINNLAGVSAQYARNVDWSETNPRSWWDNIKFGFAYDSDDFKTNQWIHPFNGAAYFNASRANGISFWPSAGFAMAGAFEWEMAGETQRMSFNDMFSTGIGGIALGEVMYRLSSEILDNHARGKTRVFREIGAFVTDPVRGFNRLLSGDAKRQANNPDDPQDWRPPEETNFVAMGARSMKDTVKVTPPGGETSTIDNGTDHTATILTHHDYGNVFDNPRRKPFDYIDFVAELNIGGKLGLENVQIRANVFSWPLGDVVAPNHVLAVVQHFEYINNPAYKFGSQSIGPALLSRFKLSHGLTLRTRVDGVVGLLLAGINSEHADLADVPNPERLREYDYGPGLGVAASASLVLHGRPLLTGLYRFDWISVSNGSVYDKGLVGLDATHSIQAAGARLVIPVKGPFGVGGDFFVFLRNSAFTFTEDATGLEKVEHVRQHDPQARFYVAVTSH